MSFLSNLFVLDTHVDTLHWRTLTAPQPPLALLQALSSSPSLSTSSSSSSLTLPLTLPQLNLVISTLQLPSTSLLSATLSSSPGASPSSSSSSSSSPSTVASASQLHVVEFSLTSPPAWDARLDGWTVQDSGDFSLLKSAADERVLVEHVTVALARSLCAQQQAGEWVAGRFKLVWHAATLMLVHEPTVQAVGEQDSSVQLLAACEESASLRSLLHSVTSRSGSSTLSVPRSVSSASSAARPRLRPPSPPPRSAAPALPVPRAVPPVLPLHLGSLPPTMLTSRLRIPDELQPYVRKSVMYESNGASHSSNGTAPRRIRNGVAHMFDEDVQMLAARGSPADPLSAGPSFASPHERPGKPLHMDDGSAAYELTTRPRSQNEQRSSRSSSATASLNGSATHTPKFSPAPSPSRPPVAAEVNELQQHWLTFAHFHALDESWLPLADAESLLPRSAERLAVLELQRQDPAARARTLLSLGIHESSAPQALKWVGPVALRYEGKSSDPVAEQDPSSRQVRRLLADSAAPVPLHVLSVPEPRVRVNCHDRENEQDIAFAAIGLWEKSHLLPLSDSKDVAFLVVPPLPSPESSSLDDALLGFFESLSSMYENCELGRHQSLPDAVADAADTPDPPSSSPAPAPLPSFRRQGRTMAPQSRHAVRPQALRLPPRGVHARPSGRAPRHVPVVQSQPPKHTLHPAFMLDLSRDQPRSVPALSPQQAYCRHVRLSLFRALIAHTVSSSGSGEGGDAPSASAASSNKYSRFIGGMGAGSSGAVVKKRRLLSDFDASKFGEFEASKFDCLVLYVVYHDEMEAHGPQLTADLAAACQACDIVYKQIKAALQKGALVTSEVVQQGVQSVEDCLMSANPALRLAALASQPNGARGLTPPAPPADGSEPFTLLAGSVNVAIKFVPRSACLSRWLDQKQQLRSLALSVFTQLYRPEYKVQRPHEDNTTGRVFEPAFALVEPRRVAGATAAAAAAAAAAAETALETVHVAYAFTKDHSQFVAAVMDECGTTLQTKSVNVPADQPFSTTLTVFWLKVLERVKPDRPWRLALVRYGAMPEEEAAAWRKHFAKKGMDFVDASSFDDGHEAGTVRRSSAEQAREQRLREVVLLCYCPEAAVTQPLDFVRIMPRSQHAHHISQVEAESLVVVHPLAMPCVVAGTLLTFSVLPGSRADPTVRALPTTFGLHACLGRNREVVRWESLAQLGEELGCQFHDMAFLNPSAMVASSRPQFALPLHLAVVQRFATGV